MLQKLYLLNKLIQSRESRVEMLTLLKLVVEEIENGLTEDDSAFEKFLISIKETDRVINNSFLCSQLLSNDQVLSVKDMDTVDSGIRRLKEQTEFLNDGIMEFEELKVASIRDIRKQERELKRYIRQL